ncbi:MAG: ABC-2 type transport system permease protein [Pseudoalteromonas tetraodonis]|jgi:ABC-2 type transport system permease protein
MQSIFPRNLFVLLSKELRGFFLSPIAYVVLGLVMVLGGFSFTAALTDLKTGDRASTLAVHTFNSLQFWLVYFFIFPVLTMRLFAEEQKLGTIETLYTAPVKSIHILLSKYLAALIFYAVLWIPSLINFAIFGMTCPDDVSAIGSLTGSYSIIFLVGVFNLAIGCFASALTANQLVAAMICFTLCLLHFLFGILMEVVKSDNINAGLVQFSEYISTVGHVRSFIDGLLDTRPFVYYISFAVLILFLTHHVLQYRKWKA